MGIIGSVLMLPAIGCALLCGALYEEAGAPGGTALLVVFAVIPMILGIVGGLKGKTDPTISFICLLVAAVASLVCLILSMFVNWITIPALILYVIGAVIAKTQKME
jgi:hypothetical protein